MLFRPSGKGRKGRKRAKKADFGRFPERAARHPLNPHLLHPPPFAAPQVRRKSTTSSEMFLVIAPLRGVSLDLCHCQTMVCVSRFTCESLGVGLKSRKEPKSYFGLFGAFGGCVCSGKSKGGLAKGGLGPKGANRAKKGPFGAISALPPWLWGRRNWSRSAPKRPR